MHKQPLSFLRYSRAFALAILAAGVVVSHARAGQTNGQTPIQKSPIKVAKELTYPIMLSFLPWQGLAVVTGRINEQNPPERMVLDTGLNACTVTTELYTRLALQALPRQVRVSALDSATDTSEVQLKTLKVGMLKLELVPAALLNTFRLISRSPRPDAPAVWLGSPFFAAFQPTFDFRNHVLLLNAPQSPLPKEPGTVIAPMQLREGRVWVKVTVPGVKAYWALVDTGSIGSLIPGEVAEKLKLKPLQAGTITRSNGREAKVGLVALPKMSVGKAEVKDVHAAFFASDAPAEFDRTLGVLGLDFLSHFKVTIDYAKQKIAFSPPTAPATPTNEENVAN